MVLQNELERSDLMTAIYLDNGATTPLHPKVKEAIIDTLDNFGNPSSIHSYGRTAYHVMEEARLTLKTYIHATAKDQLIFVSGGTESDNTAIMQTAMSRKEVGKHLITTQVEHPAVLETMRFLETQGFEVTYLPVSQTGEITVEQVKQALRPDTILVSMMYTNNETGVMFPIKEVGELLADHPAYFHTDAVQAFSLESINVKELKVDFLSATAHKINGPKGIGLLYVKEGISLPTLLHGGEQEGKKRPGTEDITGMHAFAIATSQLDDEEKLRRKELFKEFHHIIKQTLTEAQVDFSVNGSEEHTSPHVLNLWLKGVPNNLMLMRLDLEGFVISTGSACSAGNIDPSHVIEAMYGKNHPSLDESIRISFGYGNNTEDVTKFAKALASVATQLKK